MPKKLGIKEGHRVALVEAPQGIGELLGALPEAKLQAGLAGQEPLDVVLLFVTRRKDLERLLPRVRTRMAPAAGFWVAWPKKASGVATDMTDHVVREVALPTGLVDNKVCAIDETWTGLRLVLRVALRG